MKGENIEKDLSIVYYNDLNAGKAVVVAFGSGSGYAGAAKGSFKIR